MGMRDLHFGWGKRGVRGPGRDRGQALETEWAGGQGLWVSPCEVTRSASRVRLSGRSGELGGRDVSTWPWRTAGQAGHYTQGRCGVRPVPLDTPSSLKGGCTHQPAGTSFPESIKMP